MSPNSGNYNVGDSFSVSIYTTSTEQALNALSGRINYPSDKLSVTSVSKASSIVNFWTIDPGEYSSEPGVMRFEGIVLNPGYKGSRGTIFTITFKVKAQGTAPVNFLSASVLANDGKGTNILASVRDGTYVLGPVGSEFTTEEAGKGLPQAPQVISSTHKSGFEWYPINKASFAWNLAPDTTGVTYVVDKKPTTNPGTSSKGMMSMYTTDVLEDGSWYLHVRTRNEKGWGSIAHFRFQIDTTPPSKLVVTEMDKSAKTSPRARFMFESEDLSSGIKEYEIEIGTSYGTTWFENSSNIYETPALPPGEHTITVTAKDRAGNSIKEKKTFTITGLPVPKIIEYTGVVDEGEPIIIKGTTLPNFDVVLSLSAQNNNQKGSKIFYNSKNKDGVVFETTTEARADGTFTVVLAERFGADTYVISVKAVNKEGATSEDSEPVIVVVKSTGLFAGMLGGGLIGPIIIVIIILAFFLAFIWYRMRLMKYKISHELRDTEHLLARSFDILSEDAQALKRASLLSSTNDGEKRLISQHTKDIEDAERIIASRMQSMKEGLDALNEK
ncbi:MAG: hypothetical protein KBC42_01340 [Candidatus Pacebacteria bacterium]|nr:hypothetical protein [Candidatus Paceibacterota bacterium]MBP9780550.1 hypothetical protein [Candidatus Paceibacterota bacterium]